MHLAQVSDGYLILFELWATRSGRMFLVSSQLFLVNFSKPDVLAVQVFVHVSQFFFQVFVHAS